MFLSISLNQQNIGCDKICNSIQKLITKYTKDNPDIANSVLVMEIRPIYDSQIICEPLRIEHKNLDSVT